MRESKGVIIEQLISSGLIFLEIKLAFYMKILLQWPHWTREIPAKTSKVDKTSNFNFVYERRSSLFQQRVVMKGAGAHELFWD